MRHEAPQDAALLAAGIEAATLAGDDQNELRAAMMHGVEEFEQIAMRLGLSQAMQVDPTVERLQPSRDIAPGTPIQRREGRNGAWRGLFQGPVTGLAAEGSGAGTAGGGSSGNSGSMRPGKGFACRAT